MLTISVIRSIVPGKKRRAQSNGATRGLYLVTAAAPSPLKTWEYRYRSPVTKRQTAVKLGEWPAMGIADARRARDEQAALVAKGLDPAHERRRAAVVASVTLESVARAWDASRAGIVDPHTRRTAMRRLEMYVFPSLGPRPLRSIVIEVIKAAMPMRSVRAIAPQELGDKFARVQLAGALLNAVGDIPAGPILDTPSGQRRPIRGA